MGRDYWIGRKRDAMAMARAATNSATRLDHYELAGRYSVMAAHAPPFMIPEKDPGKDGGREGVRLPSPPGPGTLSPVFKPTPPLRGDPDSPPDNDR